MQERAPGEATGCEEDGQANVGTVSWFDIDDAFEEEERKAVPARVPQRTPLQTLHHRADQLQPAAVRAARAVESVIPVE